MRKYFLFFYLLLLLYIFLVVLFHYKVSMIPTAIYLSDKFYPNIKYYTTIHKCIPASSSSSRILKFSMVKTVADGVNIACLDWPMRYFFSLPARIQIVWKTAPHSPPFAKGNTNMFYISNFTFRDILSWIAFSKFC